MNKKTFFVTGGDGFIGYHICKKLLEKGHEVVIYDNHIHFVPLDKSMYPFYIDYRIKNTKGNVKRIRGDVSDSNVLRKSIEETNPDIVIHLAALPIAGTSNKYPWEAKRFVLDTISTLLDVINKCNNKIERVVYTSSSMVYGDFTREENGYIIPAREDDLCRPKGVYGVMKLAGENLVRAYNNQFGLPYVIVRPSAVYGPTDCNRRVTEIFIRRAMEGKPLMLDHSGLHQLDFTYIDDLVDGYMRICEKESALTDTFNITRGDGRKIKKLAQIVRQVVNPDIDIQDRESVDPFRPNRGTLDISRAKRKLGYRPETNLEEGIRKTFEFIRKVEI